MQLLTAQQQIEQGIAERCESTENCTGLVILAEFQCGYATWLCLECGTESYSLEGDE